MASGDDCRDTVAFPSTTGRTGRRRRGRASRGMTLVEVLVATVILGTLLSAALAARGRYLRQAAAAADLRRAAGALDALLAAWSDGGYPAGDAAAGAVRGDPRLSWRVETLDRPDAAAVHARVLRVEVLTSWTAGEVAPAAGPVTSAEVLVPEGAGAGRGAGAH